MRFEPGDTCVVSQGYRWESYQAGTNLESYLSRWKCLKTKTATVAAVSGGEGERGGGEGEDTTPP